MVLVRFLRLLLLVPWLLLAATPAVGAPTHVEFWTTELDLSYDAGDDAVEGRWTEHSLTVVGDDVDLAELSRVTVRDEEFQRLEGLEVTIATPDGRTLRLDEGDLDWTSWTPTSRQLVHLEARLQTAVIPSVGPGDRLEIRLTTRVRALHGIPPVSLAAAGAPTAERTLVLRRPRDHEILWSVKGEAGLREQLRSEETTDGRDVVSRWTLRDLDDVEPEVNGHGPPAGTLRWTAAFARTDDRPADDAFAAGADWATVGRGYARRVAPLLEADEEMATAAREIVAGATTPAGRIDRLYRHVQDSCRYLGLFEGLGGIIPEPARATFDRRYGDCKGLSVLLIAMLRAVGVEAEPVLVAADAWIDVDVPNLTQFNHFTVWADDGADGLWLDPTYDGCPAGLFPRRNVVSPVLLLRQGAVGLVEVPSRAARRGHVEIDVEGAIGADGRWRFTLRETSTGDRRLRTTLAERERDAAAREHYHYERLVDRGLRADLVATTVDGRETWDGPLIVSLDLQSRRPLLRSGERLFLGRRVLPPVRVDLAAEDRRTPLDLRRLPDRIERWRLRLPEGFAVGADSVRAAGPGISAATAWWTEGDVLHLRRELRLHERVVPADSVRHFETVLDAHLESTRGHLELLPRPPEARSTP